MKICNLPAEEFMRIIRVLILLFWAASIIKAQQKGIMPVAICDKDSVRIGEPFHVSIYLDYPAELQVFFPDSSFQYVNCVLKQRDFFPTRTRNNISRDCVVYQLACFHPDPLQELQLPVMQLNSGDTLKYPANPIRIHVISESDSLKNNASFIENTEPVFVSQRINYPYLISGIAIFLILLFLLNFFLDKPIQRFFSRWIENRRHARFIRAYEKLEKEITQTPVVAAMESLMVLWKQYLQRVEGKPYLTFTSLEINRVLPDQQLKKSLMEIDRWIYGGMAPENTGDCLSILKAKSIERYQMKLEALKVGKAGK